MGFITFGLPVSRYFFRARPKFLRKLPFWRNNIELLIGVARTAHRGRAGIQASSRKPVRTGRSGVFLPLNEDNPFPFLDDFARLVVDVDLEDQKAHVGALVLPLFHELPGYVNCVAELYGPREPPVLKAHEGYRGESRHRKPETRRYGKDTEAVRDPGLEHGVLGELLVYVHVVEIAREPGKAHHIRFGNSPARALMLGVCFEVL